MENETEIWKSHPEYAGIEVSTLGNVRTLDRVVSCRRNGKRFVKGCILKQRGNNYGYLIVNIPIVGKWTAKSVHRLVAQTFIPNHDSLPEINHKDNNPLNNNVSNLEWCTNEYNIAYREKHGIPAKYFVPKSPVYAVNLKTQETLWFESQREASRMLGANQGSVSAVVKGKLNKTHGFWFVNDDGHAVEVVKSNLHDVGGTGLKIKRRVSNKKALEFEHAELKKG